MKIEKLKYIYITFLFKIKLDGEIKHVWHSWKFSLYEKN